MIPRQANVSVVTTHYGSGSYGNINGPEVLHSYNFLNISTPVIFSHANGLTTGEASLLRSTNQYISTTAESEAAYGVGPVTAYHIADQGALGIDTHSTFSGDMITSARFWLQSVRQVLYEQVLDKWNVPVNNPVSANQVFLMATRHGGLALHRDDLGIIAEGAKADLVVFSTDSPGLLGWVDPVAAVILHANVGDIEHVLVGGKFVKRDWKLTVKDYAGIRERFLTSARRVQKIYKETPYPVLTGAYSDVANYEEMEEVDTLRGNGTGYGTLNV